MALVVLFLVSGLLWKSSQDRAVSEDMPAATRGVIEGVAKQVVDFDRGAVSARRCGSCHGEHYGDWSRSFHARSLTSEGFLRTFPQYLESVGQQARDDPQSSMACFLCHAPLLQYADRSLLRQVIDGVLLKATDKLDGFEVGCVACHAERRDVGLRDERQPHGDPFHTVTLSRSYKEASFCGACHQWAPAAIPCSDVYNDWKKSRAAKQGATCQSCHMQQRTGVAAAGEAPKKIHNHLFSGGRSAEMLRRAVSVGLKAGFRQERLEVTAMVRNLTPHRVPDG